MFILAFLIGAYSYTIFLFGVLGILYKNLVICFTVLYWGLVIIWGIRRIKWNIGIRSSKNKLFLFSAVLFGLQATVNLIGALGPELAFDALWYHLTLPKIYLENHSIFFIPGGLLYYSVMPKLGEMLYIGGLSFGNEIIPKLIHFSFGLLTCIAIYKLSRKFLSTFVSMIAVIIFYSNLVVGWQSITAYIDLTRTFFEVMALWAFIEWIDSKKLKLFIWSAVIVGLAITIKLLAVGSLIIFSFLIVIERIRSNMGIRWVREVGVFLSISLLVPLPWFVFSYLNTGNPVYPFFSEIYKVGPEPLSLVGFIKEVWILFAQSADPISPIYIIFLPLIVLLLWRTIGIRKIRRIRIIVAYSFLSIIIWYFTPRTGGGRFIIPYLPALSILCAVCLNEVLKKAKAKFIGTFLICIIIFVSLISIGYRFIANTKYLPVIFGKESKEKFLENNLNYSFGDFYDVDGYFEKNIKSTDKVLLYGFHNLYYVNFPFIDSSWLKPSDQFNYIATQNTILPIKYKDWKLVYENNKTMIKLYKP